MSFTSLDVLVLLGVVLGFFLVALIFSSKSFRSDVHQYFAITIVSLNFCLIVTWFEAYVPSNGIMEIISWDFLFPFAFMMYILKAIKHPLSSSKMTWIAAIPWLIPSFFQCMDFFLDFDVYDWLAGGNEERANLLIEIRAFSFLPYSIVLTGFSYVKIKQAENIGKQEKQWLEFNSLAILAFLVSWLFSDPFAALFDFAIWEYLLVFLALFLVVTTYLGVHRLNISEQRRRLKEIRRAEKVEQSHATIDRPASEQGDLGQLSSKTIKKIQSLHSLMEDDLLYQNPGLTRSMVANKLELSEGYLSELLSTVLGTSFNDYINKFRVNHAIKMFNDEKIDLFSIEAIGYEAGFKTKSVFYKAFKKVTQKTPGEYRKSLNLS